MIARPKISRNEWKTAETGAFEVGHVALLSSFAAADSRSDMAERGCPAPSVQRLTSSTVQGAVSQAGGMREPIVLEGGSTSDVGIAVTVLVPILVVMGCFGVCFFMSTVQPCAEEKQGRKIR